MANVGHQDDEKQPLDALLIAIDTIVDRINREASNLRLYSMLYDTVVGSLDFLTEKEVSEVRDSIITGKLGRSYEVTYEIDDSNGSICVCDKRNYPAKSTVREYTVGKIGGELGFVELKIRDMKTNETATLYGEGPFD